jgi:hypothetical protein
VLDRFTNQLLSNGNDQPGAPLASTDRQALDSMLRFPSGRIGS